LLVIILYTKLNSVKVRQVTNAQRHTQSVRHFGCGGVSHPVLRDADARHAAPLLNCARTREFTLLGGAQTTDAPWPIGHGASVSYWVR
jgi:hypothetical protein